MTFNLDKLLTLLPPGAGVLENQVFHPFQIHYWETVASTNQTLWALVAEGAPSGSVAIAGQQTAGRGQWGRQWQSGLGGLYLSLAIAPNLPASSSPHLTLCSAWGIAATLRNQGVPVLLKWPNDLVMTDRKLGGILTETKVHKGLITQAAIGVGINWANPVPETGINLQSFQTCQSAPAVASLERLAALTLQGLMAGYHRLQSEGIEALLPSYLELLSSIGHPVEVNGCYGVVVGVTATGELRVCLNPETGDADFATASTREICLKPGTINLGYSKHEQD